MVSRRPNQTDATVSDLDCVLIAIGVFFAAFVALSCLSGCSTVTAIAACAISVCN